MMIRAAQEAAMAVDMAETPRTGSGARALAASAIVALAAGDFAAELLCGDGDAMATRITTPDEAGEGALCFVAMRAAAEAFPADAAGFICIALPDLAEAIPAGRGGTLITTGRPKDLLARAMGVMYGRPYHANAMAGGMAGGGIHASAVIAPDARIGKDVAIAAHAVIGEGAAIGDGAVIAAGAVIGAGCSIGRGATIGANSVLSHCRVGDGTHIGPLAKIGTAGFGLGLMGGDNDGGGDGGGKPANTCLPHIGGVVIGRDCHISGQCCIDRGFIQDTIIGNGVMIDNLVHIAHNCHIGDNTVICGQSGFAGSCRIGADNVFGAMCGVADNIRIGDGNVFAARSGVTKDTGDGMALGGFPAVPMAEFRRQAAAIRRLGRGGGSDDANGNATAREDEGT